jgi:hypothetical protein
VGKMLANIKAYSYFLDGVRRYTNKWNLEFHLLGVTREEIENIRDKIIEDAPKTYRRQVSKLINVILDNFDKIETLFNGGDETVRELSVRFLRDVLINGEYLKGDEYGKILIKYVPLPVRYVGRKEIKDGYAIFPSEKEIEKITEIDSHPVSTVLTEVVNKHIKFNDEEQSVELFGEKFSLDTEKYITLLDRLGRTDEKEKFIEKKVRDVIGEGYEVRADIFGEVTIKLNSSKVKTELAKNLLNDMTIRMRGSLTSDKWSVTVNHPLLNFKYTTNGTYEELPEIIDKVYEEIGRKLDNYMGHIAEIVSFTKSIEGELDVEPVEYYYYGEGNPSYRIRTKDGFEMHVTVTDKGKRIFMRYSVDVGRRKLTDDIFKKLLYGIPGLKEYRVYKSGRTVTISLEPENQDLLLSYVIGKEVVGRTRKLLEAYDQYKETVKEVTGKLSPEHYMALYLVRHVLLRSFDAQLLTGRDEAVLYSAVGRIVRKLSPDEYRELKEYYAYERASPLVAGANRVFEILVKKGYITLDMSGEVLLNRKEFIKLLKDLGVPHHEAVEVNDELAGEYLRRLDYEGRGQEFLKSPEIIKIAIERTYIDVPLEYLVKEYYGRPVWKLLDSNTRSLWIEKKARPEYLYRILTNEEYKKIFDEELDQIKKKLIEMNWNLGTKYLAKYEPNIISGTGNVKLIETDKMIGIDGGDFILQVTGVKELSSDSEKRFIVFHKKEGIGFPLKAITVEDAVSKARKLYPQLKSEIEELKKLEMERPEVRLWTEKMYDKYRMYTVIIRTIPVEEHIVRPGITKLVKSKLPKREEVTRKGESISL